MKLYTYTRKQELIDKILGSKVFLVAYKSRRARSWIEDQLYLISFGELERIYSVVLEGERQLNELEDNHVGCSSHL